MSVRVDELLEDNLLTPPFTCMSFKAESYKFLIEEFANNEYLIVDLPYDAPTSLVGKNLNNYAKWAEKSGCTFQKITTTNIEYLVGLIRVIEAMLLNQNKESFKEELICFCSNHGIPLTQFIEIESEHTILGFSIERLVEQLSSLYTRYSLWLYLQLGDDSNIRDYLSRFENVDRSIMQEAIIQASNHRLHACIAYSDDKPEFRYECENMIDLANVQMSFLIGKGDRYLDGAIIENCEDCGNKYVKRRANATLCPACKGNTGKSRRYRKNKKIKEAANNASEN